MLLSLRARAERVDRRLMPIWLSSVPPCGGGQPLHTREEIPPYTWNLGSESGPFSAGGDVRFLKALFLTLPVKSARPSWLPSLHGDSPMFRERFVGAFPGRCPPGGCLFRRCLDRYRVPGGNHRSLRLSSCQLTGRSHSILFPRTLKRPDLLISHQPWIQGSETYSIYRQNPMGL